MSKAPEMYCPGCKTLQACYAFNPRELVGRADRRLYFRQHHDVHWFRRGRNCGRCGHRFVTAEVAEHFLDELVELRDALADVKHNAEAYMGQSAEASATLVKLTTALDVLRALKVYEQSPP